MKKHAYCIIAHNEIEVLKLLISLIDDRRNDIYLHIDKKVQDSAFFNLSTQYSKIYYTKKRIDIRWGDFSQIEAELTLFEEASQKATYSYYHLLSGVDLPIKSQNYIHEFFNMNSGKEFIGICSSKMDENNILERTEHYHILTKYYKSHRIPRLISHYLRESFLAFQRKLGIRRKFDITMKKGPNWVSVTQEMVAYVLSKKQYIFKKFKYIPCVDEHFLQSLAWNSNFKNNIFITNDEYISCMREIDWKRGTPYIWGQHKDDIKLLADSQKLFARKFSSKYPQILIEIKELLSSHNNDKNDTSFI